MKKNVFRKSLVVGIIILFFGASVIPSMGLNVVKRHFPDDVKTTFKDTRYGGYIQDLIDNASDGDTIFIPSGIYYEHIIINKTISLVGEDKNNTVIDGSWNGDVVNISADLVNISGFTIQNSGWGDWPWGAYHGIITYYNYSIISGNNITNNQYGIRLSGYRNTISSNTITNNSGIPEGGVGIMLFGDNNTISGNIITNNKGAGINLYGDNNTISDNTIISNNFDGIDLIGKYNIISGNTITNNWYSIFLSVASNNIIYGNTITNNVNGVILDVGSDSNLIIDNTIKNIQYDGITLDSNSNIIFDNTITNNNEGIYLHGNNNIISDNNIINNELFGIINWNNLFSNNTIYHNNFINNQINAIVSGNNTWDDGKYGNYWSDYEEKYPYARKLWWKGIWDTPYEIEEGDKKDNCPLIKQWSKSKSKTMTGNLATFNPLFYWFLERFPMLQRLLQRLGLQ